MASRRERQQLRKGGKREQASAGGTRSTATVEKRAGKAGGGFLYRLYHDHHKLLLWFSLLILFLAIVQIGVQTYQTGDFLNKGVTLKGGFTITIPVEGEAVTADQVRSLLVKEFSNEDLRVQSISEFGTLKALTIEVAQDNAETVPVLEKSIIAALTPLLPNAAADYSVEIVGSALGDTFFTQTMTAVTIAFFLMGMVLFFYFANGWKLKALIAVLTVLESILIYNLEGALLWLCALPLGVLLAALYFRHSLPSVMVILCAFADIVGTLAIVNLLGIKVNTAGIAAFLMLIGYSVDTDILLSTRVLKHKTGTVFERILSSLRTGMTMSVTSMVAAFIGFLVSQSATVREIMLIVSIGLLLDIIFTWCLNVGLLRWYVEKRLGWEV